MRQWDDDEKPDDVRGYSPGYAASIRDKSYGAPAAGTRLAVGQGRSSMGRRCCFGASRTAGKRNCSRAVSSVYGPRFPLKAGAIAEAGALRNDLLQDGWVVLVTRHPAK